MNINPAIGVSDFKRIREIKINGEHKFYADKTLIVKDLINDDADFILFTRPRRFGKTLNMSMLDYFFDKRENRHLFDGLDISRHPDVIENFQGKFPTIFITFGGVNTTNYLANIHQMTNIFSEALERKSVDYKLETDDFSKPNPTLQTLLIESLKEASRFLYTRYNSKVVVIVDEYDTPLNNAYANGYLKEALDFFKSFFSTTFKYNPYIYKGIITGINRIAKENIFSGLNNFRSYDIDESRYSTYFGFTETDLEKLNIPPQKKDEIKEWYNGYRFGKSIIYNPWSVLYYIDKEMQPDVYWSNTGGMQMIEKNVHIDQIKDLNTLLVGKSIELEINNDLIYTRLENNRNAFFNLLYFAGYLTRDSANPGDLMQANLKIVNKEITISLGRLVKDWFSRKNDFHFFVELLEAFTTGDAEEIQEKLQETILQTISFHDATKKQRETFYHGLMLGVSLIAKNRYHIKSNRESGLGRYDIAWYPKEIEKDPGILIELKVNNLSSDESLNQIDTKMYKSDLLSHGCKKIFSYGIHYNGKIINVKRENTD